LLTIYSTDIIIDIQDVDRGINMHCPFCNNEETRVLDSRQIEGGMAVRRRRACDACLRRFTTYEKYEDIQLVVVKKDGSREQFSRQKLMSGLQKACEKRPIPTETLEQAVSEIERYFRDENEREVASEKIGEAVMDRLFELDEVAYIRFASVYRQFKDIQKFMEELNQLIKKKNN